MTHLNECQNCHKSTNCFMVYNEVLERDIIICEDCNKEVKRITAIINKPYEEEVLI